MKELVTVKSMHVSLSPFLSNRTSLYLHNFMQWLYESVVGRNSLLQVLVAT